MSNGTHVDPAVLDALAKRLRQAGDSLDSAGNRAPGVPDAGDVTALIGGVMGHLTGSAGNLVDGLREAGARVAQSRDAYTRQDAAAVRNLQGLF